MRSTTLLVMLCCVLVAASAAPSFKLLAKVKLARTVKTAGTALAGTALAGTGLKGTALKGGSIKYKLLPHLGFAKYNAVRYEPLKESPAAAPVFAPYPAEAPAGPYPAAL